MEGAEQGRATSKEREGGTRMWVGVTYAMPQKKIMNTPLVFHRSARKPPLIQKMQATT